MNPWTPTRAGTDTHFYILLHDRPSHSFSVVDVRKSGGSSRPFLNEIHPRVVAAAILERELGEMPGGEAAANARPSGCHPLVATRTRRRRGGGGGGCASTKKQTGLSFFLLAPLSLSFQHVPGQAGGG